ncbi:MAG: asparaginase [Gemmatimonadales bacterium]
MLPLLQDGAVERFKLTAEELAIACASHSSEPIHLETVDRFLAKLALDESALACGPHVPLGPDTARRVAREGIVMTPRWSNCSGKHAGMLALAKCHGWPAAGYEALGHPVQERIVAEVERWTGLGRDELVLTVDGCNTTCFGLPLDAMALAYARFATSTDTEARRLWRAVTNHPDLVPAPSASAPS